MSSDSHSRDRQNKTYLFENAPISSAVWTMAVPTIVTQLINIVYNFADTWYVGRTADPAMVATLGVCFPIFVIMAALANLFGIGGASAISRSLGQKNPQRARRVCAFSFWGGMAAAVVYLLIMALFRTQIIYLVGGDENDFAYISTYIFWTMIVGAIPTVGNVLCGHLVRAMGASKEAGFGMSMGGVLNIILDPLFMFVILPPGHEIAGAAIATCLSNTAAFVYFIIYIVKADVWSASSSDPGYVNAAWSGSPERPTHGKGTVQAHGSAVQEDGQAAQSSDTAAARSGSSSAGCRSGAAQDGGFTRSILTLSPREVSFSDHIPGDVLMIGLPAALQTTLAMVSNIFANDLVREYGSAAVAGMGVAKKINMIAFNTCMGMTQGVLPLLGYCCGAGNIDRMKKIIRYTWTVILAFGLCCTALFFTFAPQLIRFFIDEESSVRFGTQFLRIIGFAAPLAAGSYLVNTVFQSTGRKTQSFILSILRKGLLDIPAMFVFRSFLGAAGVCAATPFAEVVAAVIAVGLYRSLWKTPLLSS